MTTTEASPKIQAPTRQASSRKYISYLIFALWSSFYLLPFMRLLPRGTGADEGTLIYDAVRVVNGQVFARDFFEVMGPGTFYWLALFFKLFGVTFVATRICLFLTSLGTGLLVYFLSRRTGMRYPLLPCILLAGTYCGPVWPGISHHMDSNFFTLMSVACMVLWEDRRKNSLLFAAGLLAGATTWFHQPKGMLLLVSILLWLLIQRRRRSNPIAALRAVMGGYCSAIAIVLAYFWSRGALRDLIYANFVWPSTHYGAVNVVSYAHGLIYSYWDSWVIAKGSFNWSIGLAAVLITPFLFVAALPALLLLLGARYKWSTAKPVVALYFLCGSALWLSEFHRKDIYHLVFGSPLLIILCIHLLTERREKVADLALQVLTISAGCLACFNLFLVLSTHPMATRVGPVAMFKADPVLTFLNEHVPPGEEIFSYPYCPMYYFLSSTTNPTRYSLLIYNYNTTYQFEEVIRVLDQRRVRHVVWNTSFEDKFVYTFFPASKRMRPDELIIEPYLESHYNLLKDENGTRIMERKSEDHAN